MSRNRSLEERRDQRRTNDPMTFRIAGPRLAMRLPDSAHILSFSQLEFEHGSYHNSVPITTTELRDLRNKITEWLGDDYGPRPNAG